MKKLSASSYQLLACREEGFSLIEVMLAMVILAFAVVGVMGMYHWADYGLRLGANGIKALALAESRLEAKRAAPWDGLLADDLDFDGRQQTIDAGTLPAAFLSNANPAGPVPQGNSATLQAEIMGQSDNNADTPAGSPNTSAQMNNFTVNGDIDRLYAVPKAGGSMQFAAGYEGSAGGTAGGGVDIMYRVDCVATNTAVGTVSRITAVYACTVTGESCQRKL
jgi:prepilin-type N-terminal cleavage/methylation domain-containing protein